MSNKFSDHVKEFEQRATRRVRAQLEVWREHYDVAEQVLRLRIQHGMTQQQLADASGVQQSEISRIERGIGNPTAETLQRLASPLHAKVSLVHRADEHKTAMRDELG
jgi:DNA-binding XRE family transcriptional regulator